MLWHYKEQKQVLNELNTNFESGLSGTEAKKRLKKYGKNVIEDKKKDCLAKKFIAQFKDFMIIILLMAAAVSFITSLIDGSADFADPVIILVIVIFNAIVGVVQENKAEKSIEALKKIVPEEVMVRREGKLSHIKAEDLVPGDVVILKTGDKVSADCRIIEATELVTDESSLTGESVPVNKSCGVIKEKNIATAEQKNMLWAGSMVVGGKGKGVVCSTGMNTEMGNIASLIILAEENETPLKKKLADVSKILGMGALLICVMVFIIGVFERIPVFDMFITAVSLAVAAIPEGLPAIVTIMLAIGVQRMAKRGAIIRNLTSVETLGCASVICSDKTGTLTENCMMVTEAYSNDKRVLFRFAIICMDEESINPTDKAILMAAEKEYGLKKSKIDKRYKKLEEISFSSERKRMSVSFMDNGSVKSVTKGAPDVVLGLCSYYYDGGKKLAISEKMKNKILEKNEEMAESALRVIAVAYRDISEKKPNEKNLIFIGLIGIEDPPRHEAEEAVKICRRAGILPIMITGDHMATAKAIAKKVGILQKNDKIMPGSELEKISQKELERIIDQYSVYARVTPAHKARIVKAWQKKGAVVAMTGDGVNDAPALKSADIGCSMGISGTDVAKNAADMILTDDNFATIVEAVRCGRGIFANIRKAVQFLLSSNIGEILTVFVGILFTGQTPLLAIQLLWVNLVTDSLPAIALGIDPPDKFLMEERPRDIKEGLFSGKLWFDILTEGMMIGALALFAFIFGNIKWNILVGRTMAFSVLSMSQLIHAFNTRSEHSIFLIGFFSNMYLVGAFVIGVVLQCAVVSIPILANLFKVTQLNEFQWVITAVLSAAPLAIVELQKFLNHLFDSLNTKK